MAVLKPIVASQAVKHAEFVFNFDDTMLDVNGVSKDFKTYGATVTFDSIKLPPNSIIVGGAITEETAYAGPTAATLTVGDSSSTSRYASIDLMGTSGRTALTLTGFVNTTGLPIRITLAPTVANATAGKVRVTVMYVQQGQSDFVTG